MNGEYDATDKTLTYRLAHHDAPTGEFYIVSEGFHHPVTEEILPEAPVLDITVSYYRDFWQVGAPREWCSFRTKKAAVSMARRIACDWRGEGYKTKVVIKNKNDPRT